MKDETPVHSRSSELVRITAPLFRTVRALCTLAVVVVAVTMLITLTPDRASALCMRPSEDGAWVNANANTRSITRVPLRFVCNDTIHNGEVAGPDWYVHLFGKCHPSDCDWGEIAATRHENGWIYGVYNQGFAKRYVWTRTYSGPTLRIGTELITLLTNGLCIDAVRTA